MTEGPIAAIRELPERPLIDLALALRAGRLAEAATAFTVRYAVPAVSETAAAELSSLLRSGLGVQHQHCCSTLSRQSGSCALSCAQRINRTFRYG